MPRRFAAALLLMPMLSQGAVAMQPRAWNSEYAMWRRGTTFTNSGSGVPTADQTRNGPCVGGTEVISKADLVAAIRAQLAASPLINTPPRFAKKVTWLVAPTAGEGRKGGSSTYCSGGTEDWIEPVLLSAGRTVTNMACVWVSSGRVGFYLYGSQWTGLEGASGKHGVGNFSGTGPGKDMENFPQEILHRSSKFTATTTPRCFSYSFALDDLSRARIGLANAYIIGVGFDYFDLEAGVELFLTAVDYQVGTRIVPWEPTPDALAEQLSKAKLQIWGTGVVGFSTSSTSILITLPYQGGFQPPSPFRVVEHYSPPHFPALRLLNRSPQFQVGAGCSGCARLSANNATIERQEFGPSGGYVVINGFTDLPVGYPVINLSPGPLIQAEYW